VLAGLADVEIGDTIADPADPDPLPRLTVDEPVLRMTFGPNTSPISGKEGAYVTSRHIRDRLAREVLGNVAIKVEDTESPDVIQVAGRGELQLAVLIETMRREGYELEVSRPEVITKDIDGKRHEPLEEGVADVPDDHVGTVTQALAPRKGKVIDMRPVTRPHARDVRGAGAGPPRPAHRAPHRHPGHDPPATPATGAGRRGSVTCRPARAAP
jgi:GTP-binding protein